MRTLATRNVFEHLCVSNIRVGIRVRGLHLVFCTYLLLGQDFISDPLRTYQDLISDPLTYHLFQEVQSSNVQAVFLRGI